MQVKWVITMQSETVQETNKKCAKKHNEQAHRMIGTWLPTVFQHRVTRYTNFTLECDMDIAKPDWNIRKWSSQLAGSVFV